MFAYQNINSTSTWNLISTFQICLFHLENVTRIFFQVWRQARVNKIWNFSLRIKKYVQWSSRKLQFMDSNWVLNDLVLLCFLLFIKVKILKPASKATICKALTKHVRFIECINPSLFFDRPWFTPVLSINLFVLWFETHVRRN